MRSCACVCAHLCLILCDLKDGSPPGFLSMGFPRQEYWSGLPVPPPGDLPSPGIEPGSPSLQAGSLLSEPLGGLNGDKKQESRIATLVCLLNMDFLSS